MLQIPVFPRLLPGGRLTAMLVCAGTLGMLIDAAPSGALTGARPAARAWPPPVRAAAPLRLSELKVDASGDRALVSWTTSASTDTVIEFDGSNATGSTTSFAQASTTRHAVELRGLHPQTVYRYSIVARDGSGRSHRFGPFELTTARGEPPPQPWVCGHYCGVSRMTPDERERLRASIQRFTDPRTELTGPEKRRLLETRTAPAKDDEFSNRLQLARSWMNTLTQKGRNVEALAKQPKLLQTLYYTNKVQAARKLDQFFQALNATESRP